MIPALLQTAEYARMALTFARDLDEDDVAKAAVVRVELPAALFESRREFSSVLTEGAVRTWPGSPLLMRAQYSDQRIRRLERARGGRAEGRAPEG
jgi:hypothetical protein